MQNKTNILEAYKLHGNNQIKINSLCQYVFHYGGVFVIKGNGIYCSVVSAEYPYRNNCFLHLRQSRVLKCLSNSAGPDSFWPPYTIYGNDTHMHLGARHYKTDRCFTTTLNFYTNHSIIGKNIAYLIVQSP